MTDRGLRAVADMAAHQESLTRLYFFRTCVSGSTL